MEPALPIIRWQREEETTFTFKLSVGRNWLDLIHDPPRILVATESENMAPADPMWCYKVSSSDGKTVLLDPNSSPVVEFRHVPNPGMELLSSYQFRFPGIPGCFTYTTVTQETRPESQETTTTRGRLSQLSTQSLEGSPRAGGVVATQMDSASDDETVDPRDVAMTDRGSPRTKEPESSKLDGEQTNTNHVQVRLLPPIAFDYGDEEDEDELLATQCETAVANPPTNSPTESMPLGLGTLANAKMETESQDAKGSVDILVDTHSDKAQAPIEKNANESRDLRNDSITHDAIINDSKDATMHPSTQESGSSNVTFQAKVEAKHQATKGPVVEALKDKEASLSGDAPIDTRVDVANDLRNGSVSQDGIINDSIHATVRRNTQESGIACSSNECKTIDEEPFKPTNIDGNTTESMAGEALVTNSMPSLTENTKALSNNVEAEVRVEGKSVDSYVPTDPWDGKTSIEVRVRESRESSASNHPGSHDAIIDESKGRSTDHGISGSSNIIDPKTSNEGYAEETKFNANIPLSKETSASDLKSSVTGLLNDKDSDDKAVQSIDGGSNPNTTDSEPSIIDERARENVVKEHTDRLMDVERAPSLENLEPTSDADLPQDGLEGSRSHLKSDECSSSLADATRLADIPNAEGSTCDVESKVAKKSDPSENAPDLPHDLAAARDPNANNSKSMPLSDPCQPLEVENEAVDVSAALSSQEVPVIDVGCEGGAMSRSERIDSTERKSGTMRCEVDAGTDSGGEIDNEKSSLLIKGPEESSATQRGPEKHDSDLENDNRVDVGIEGLATPRKDSNESPILQNGHKTDVGATEGVDKEAVTIEVSSQPSKDSKKSPGAQSDTVNLTSKRKADPETDPQTDAQNAGVDSFEVSRTRKRNKVAATELSGIGKESTDKAEKTADQGKSETDGQKRTNPLKPPRRPKPKIAGDLSDDDSDLNFPESSPPKRRVRNVKSNARSAKKPKVVLSQNSTTNEVNENREKGNTGRPKRGTSKLKTESPEVVETPIKTPRRRTSARTPSKGIAASVRILVTGVELTARQLKIVSSLGGEIVAELSAAIHATHVIASDKGSIRRTPKLMIALCRTPNIVSLGWLTKSGACGKWLPCEPFLILNDRKAERIYDFSMKQTLTILRDNLDAKRYILDGWSVYVCDGVAGNKAPMKDELKCIVEATGAKWVSSVRGCVPASLLILTSDPELESQISKKAIRSALDMGATKRTIKWFFGATFKQITDLQDV